MSQEIPLSLRLILVEAMIEGAIKNLKQGYDEELEKPEPMSDACDRLGSSSAMLEVVLEAIKIERRKL